MAAYFTGGALPGIRSMLHDDHHVSNDWFLKNGAFPLTHTAGHILCAFHSDFAKTHWRNRHLSLPARRRWAYNTCMSVSREVNETNSIEKYAAQHNQNLSPCRTNTNYISFINCSFSAVRLSASAFQSFSTIFLSSPNLSFKYCSATSYTIISALCLL